MLFVTEKVIRLLDSSNSDFHCIGQFMMKGNTYVQQMIVGICFVPSSGNIKINQTWSLHLQST